MPFIRPSRQESLQKIGCVVGTSLAFWLLAGCAFEKQPSRWNNVAGGKHAPILNPGGSESMDPASAGMGGGSSMRGPAAGSGEELAAMNSPMPQGMMRASASPVEPVPNARRHGEEMMGTMPETSAAMPTASPLPRRVPVGNQQALAAGGASMAMAPTVSAVPVDAVSATPMAPEPMPPVLAEATPVPPMAPPTPALADAMPVAPIPSAAPMPSPQASKELSNELRAERQSNVASSTPPAPERPVEAKAASIAPMPAAALPETPAIAPQPEAPKLAMVEPPSREMTPPPAAPEMKAAPMMASKETDRAPAAEPLAAPAPEMAEAPKPAPSAPAPAPAPEIASIAPMSAAPLPDEPKWVAPQTAARPMAASSLTMAEHGSRPARSAEPVSIPVAPMLSASDLAESAPPAPRTTTPMPEVASIAPMTATPMVASPDEPAPMASASTMGRHGSRMNTAAEAANPSPVPNAAEAEMARPAGTSPTPTPEVASIMPMPAEAIPADAEPLAAPSPKKPEMAPSAADTSTVPSAEAHPEPVSHAADAESKKTPKEPVAAIAPMPAAPLPRATLGDQAAAHPAKPMPVFASATSAELASTAPAAGTAPAASIDQPSIASIAPMAAPAESSDGMAPSPTASPKTSKPTTLRALAATNPYATPDTSPASVTASAEDTATDRPYPNLSDVPDKPADFDQKKNRLKEEAQHFVANPDHAPTDTTPTDLGETPGHPAGENAAMPAATTKAAAEAEIAPASSEAALSNDPSVAAPMEKNAKDIEAIRKVSPTDPLPTPAGKPESSLEPAAEGASASEKLAADSSGTSISRMQEAGHSYYGASSTETPAPAADSSANGSTEVTPPPSVSGSVENADTSGSESATGSDSASGSSSAAPADVGGSTSSSSNMLPASRYSSRTQADQPGVMRHY